jgi:hypothetical protein
MVVYTNDKGARCATMAYNGEKDPHHALKMLKGIGTPKDTTIKESPLSLPPTNDGGTPMVSNMGKPKNKRNDHPALIYLDVEAEEGEPDDDESPSCSDDIIDFGIPLDSDDESDEVTNMPTTPKLLEDVPKNKERENPRLIRVFPLRHYDPNIYLRGYSVVDGRDAWEHDWPMWEDTSYYGIQLEGPRDIQNPTVERIIDFPITDDVDVNNPKVFDAILELVSWALERRNEYLNLDLGPPMAHPEETMKAWGEAYYDRLALLQHKMDKDAFHTSVDLMEMMEEDYRRAVKRYNENDLFLKRRLLRMVMDFANNQVAIDVKTREYKKYLRKMANGEGANSRGENQKGKTSGENQFGLTPATPANPRNHQGGQQGGGDGGDDPRRPLLPRAHEVEENMESHEDDEEEVYRRVPYPRPSRYTGKPRVSEPAKFVGKDVVQWLDAYELYFTITDADPAKWSMMARLGLGTTYAPLVQRRLEALRPNGPWTWEDFRKTLTEMYADPDESRQAVEKLSRLTQGNSTTTEYIKKWDNIMCFIKDEHRPRTWQLVTWFLEGLSNVQLQGRMRITPDLKEWDSWELLRDAVRRTTVAYPDMYDRGTY